MKLLEVGQGCCSMSKAVVGSLWYMKMAQEADHLVTALYRGSVMLVHTIAGPQSKVLMKLLLLSHGVCLYHVPVLPRQICLSHENAIDAMRVASIWRQGPVSQGQECSIHGWLAGLFTTRNPSGFQQGSGLPRLCQLCIATRIVLAVWSGMAHLKRQSYNQHPSFFMNISIF